MKTMSDVAEVVGGSTPRTSEPSYWGGDIAWITPNDLSGYEGKYIGHGERFITESGYQSCSTTMLPPKTVLFTSRAPIGYVAIAQNEVCTNQGFKNFICGPDVAPDYVYWYLKSAKQLAQSMGSGTTFRELSARAAKMLPIPVPSLDEQRQIVGELEKQVPRLDAATMAFERIKSNLKRYKASVLRAACTGYLSRDELGVVAADMRTANASNGLPPLPPAWHWKTFEQVAERITVGHVGPMKNEYVSEGVPFLRSQNVRPNRFDARGLKFVSPAFHAKLKKSSLRPGDVVVVRSGDVGTACVVPDRLKDANCADLVIIQRPYAVHPRFAAYYLNSVAKSLIEAGKVGVALTHFNTKSVASLPVPVPPRDEQEAIVEEVERRFSVIDELEGSVETELKRAAALRQVILQHAFSGRLTVSNDLELATPSKRQGE